MKSLIFPFLFLAGLALPAAAAQPPGARPAQAEAIPAIEKLGGNRFKLGEIVIDKAHGAITFPAQVNMSEGLLEYLLVHEKGKTHESLLRTQVDPYHMQMAFLLLGYKPSEQRLQRQGDPTPPRGEALQIRISADAGKTWFETDKWLIQSLEGKKKPVPPMQWIYTGSYEDRGRFMARQSGSVVAIWHDPVALVDNATPGGENNRIWFVNAGVVPAVGTPVEISLRRAK